MKGILIFCFGFMSILSLWATESYCINTEFTTEYNKYNRTVNYNQAGAPAQVEYQFTYHKIPRKATLEVFYGNGESGVIEGTADDDPLLYPVNVSNIHIVKYCSFFDMEPRLKDLNGSRPRSDIWGGNPGIAPLKQQYEQRKQKAIELAPMQRELNTGSVQDGMVNMEFWFRTGNMVVTPCARWRFVPVFERWDPSAGTSGKWGSGGNSYTMINGYPPNDTPYFCDGKQVLQFRMGKYRYKVMAKNSDGRGTGWSLHWSEFSTIPKMNVSLGDVRPYISIKVPKENAVFTHGEPIHIYWDSLKIEEKIKISLINLGHPTIKLTKNPDGIDNTGYWRCTVPADVKPGSYLLSVSTVDNEIKDTSLIKIIMKLDENAGDILKSKLKIEDASDLKGKVNLGQGQSMAAYHTAPKPVQGIDLKLADLTAEIRIETSENELRPIYTVHNRGNRSAKDFRVEVYYQLSWQPDQGWQQSPYGYEDIDTLGSGDSLVVSAEVANPLISVSQGMNGVAFKVRVDAKNNPETNKQNNIAIAYFPPMITYPTASVPIKTDLKKKFGLSRDSFNLKDKVVFTVPGPDARLQFQHREGNMWRMMVAPKELSSRKVAIVKGKAVHREYRFKKPGRYRYRINSGQWKTFEIKGSFSSKASRALLPAVKPGKVKAPQITSLRPGQTFSADDRIKLKADYDRSHKITFVLQRKHGGSYRILKKIGQPRLGSLTPGAYRVGVVYADSKGLPDKWIEFNVAKGKKLKFSPEATKKLDTPGSSSN